MTSLRKPGPVLPIAVTLMVLVMLYLGTYYGTLTVGHEPTTILSYNPTVIVRTPAPVNAQDRIVDEWLTPFFSPAHRLDRELRPHV